MTVRQTILYRTVPSTGGGRHAWGYNSTKQTHAGWSFPFSNDAMSSNQPPWAPPWLQVTEGLARTTSSVCGPEGVEGGRVNPTGVFRCGPVHKQTKPAGEVRSFTATSA